MVYRPFVRSVGPWTFILWSHLLVLRMRRRMKGARNAYDLRLYCSFPVVFQSTNYIRNLIIIRSSLLWRRESGLGLRCDAGRPVFSYSDWSLGFLSNVQIILITVIPKLSHFVSGQVDTHVKLTFRIHYCLQYRMNTVCSCSWWRFSVLPRLLLQLWVLRQYNSFFETVIFTHETRSNRRQWQ